MPDPEIGEGTQFGPFRILRELGRGSMGIVYLAGSTEPAHGLGIGERVAVKIIRPEMTEDEKVNRRFHREARFGSRVRHENVVPTLGSGEVEHGGRSRHYIVFEFVEGSTLKQLVSGGPFTEARVREVGRQMAAGLEAIHRAGLVHRDVKPANVIVTDAGLVRMLDLGLARLVEQSTTLESLTSSTIGFVGTVTYAAPEQFQSPRVDGRADLYSMGAVLYELLAGSRPLPAERILELLEQINSKRPRPVRDLAGSTPEWLSDALDVALEKSPRDRFRTAGEFKNLLEAGEDSDWRRFERMLDDRAWKRGKHRLEAEHVRTGLRFVMIPAGLLTIAPGRAVRLRAHLLCSAPCSREAWDRVGGRDRRSAEPAGPGHPVNGVSWEQARDWCGRAGLRLPSEAEWEHAFRPAKGLDHGSWGLSDAGGTVWEWCEDAYHEGALPEDGAPFSSDETRERVLRGGCRLLSAKGPDPGRRDWGYADTGNDTTGFRPAADLS